MTILSDAGHKWVKEQTFARKSNKYHIVIRSSVLNYSKYGVVNSHFGGQDSCYQRNLAEMALWLQIQITSESPVED